MLSQDKVHHLDLHIGDWLTDHQVTRCSPATRGIWIDFLCSMTKADRSGVIAGTREELALFGRCSAVALGLALSELQNTGAADVTERDGIVTVVNRRMKRVYLQRVATRKRVRKHRGSEAVTPPEGIGDWESGIGDRGSRIEDGGVQGGKPRRTDPVWDAVADLYFCGNVAGPDKKRCGKIVRDLKAKGATGPDVYERHWNLWDSWRGKIAITPEALAKHFGSPQCVNPPAERYHEVSGFGVVSETELREQTWAVPKRKGVEDAVC